jgi:hypothetical protein
MEDKTFPRVDARMIKINEKPQSNIAWLLMPSEVGCVSSAGLNCCPSIYCISFRVDHQMVTNNTEPAKWWDCTASGADGESLGIVNEARRVGPAVAAADRVYRVYEFPGWVFVSRVGASDLPYPNLTPSLPRTAKYSKHSSDEASVHLIHSILPRLY